MASTSASTPSAGGGRDREVLHLGPAALAPVPLGQQPLDGVGHGGQPLDHLVGPGGVDLVDGHHERGHRRWALGPGGPAGVGAVALPARPGRRTAGQHQPLDAFVVRPAHPGRIVHVRPAAQRVEGPGQHGAVARADGGRRVDQGHDDVDVDERGRRGVVQPLPEGGAGAVDPRSVDEDDLRVGTVQDPAHGVAGGVGARSR